MEKITNRLQFLHSSGIFSSLDDIKSARNKWCMKNGGSLYAEPMVFLMDDGNGGANLVLAIGKNESDASYINIDGTNNSIKAIEKELASDSKAIDNLKSLYDDLKEFCGGSGQFKSVHKELEPATNLAGAIDTLMSFVKSLGESLKAKGITTPTTTTTVKQTASGQEIGVDVTLSKQLVKDNRVYQNDIIVNGDGIFSNVEVSISGNKLFVTKNGETKEFQLPEEKYVSSGAYSIEKEGIVLTLNNGETVFVNLKSLLNEWKTNNAGKSVILNKKRVEYSTESGISYQDELSADLKLYKSDNYIDNIIQTDDDGCVYVDMNLISKKIDDAVGEIVCSTSKTNGNIVKLMSDGLYASVNLDYIPESNSLVFNNGIGESKVFQLEDFSSLSEPVEYNVTNDTLHIHYLTNTGRDLHVSIPLGPIWNELQADNENSNVEVKIERTQFGHTLLSAKAKISSDEDNLLKEQDGSLIVKVDGSNIKTDNRMTVDQRFSLAEGNINDLNGRIDSIAKTIDKDITNEILALSNNLNATNQAISGVTDNITALTNKVNRHTSKIKAIEANAEKMADELQEISEKQLTTTDVRSTVESMGYAKSEAVNTLNKILETQISKLQSTDEKVAEVAKSIDGLQDITSELSNELGALSTTVDSIEREIGKVISDQSGFVTDAKFSTSIDEIRHAITANSNLISLLDKELDATKDQLSNRVSANDAKINDSIEKIGQLELKVKSIESSISNITNTIKSTIIDNITLEKSEGTTKTTYTLKYGSTYLGSPIEVPNSTASSIVTKVSYDNGTHTLIITWSNGQETSVPLTDLVNVYEAGNGLEMRSNVFSVKVSEDSKDYLSVNAGGLSFKTSKIDELNKAIAEINTTILTLQDKLEQNKDAIAAILNHKSIGSFSEMVEYVNDVKDQLTNTFNSEIAVLNTTISSIDKQITKLNNDLTGSTKSLSDRIDSLSSTVDQKIAKEVSDRNTAIHNSEDSLKEAIGKKADNFDVFNRETDTTKSALRLDMKINGDGQKILYGNVEISTLPDNALKNSNGALYVSSNAKDVVYKNTNVATQLDRLEDQIESLVSGGTITVKVVSDNDGNKLTEGTDKGAYFDGSLDYGTFTFTNP